MTKVSLSAFLKIYKTQLSPAVPDMSSLTKYLGHLGLTGPWQFLALGRVQEGQTAAKPMKPHHPHYLGAGLGLDFLGGPFNSMGLPRRYKAQMTEIYLITSLLIKEKRNSCLDIKRCSIEAFVWALFVRQNFDVAPQGICGSRADDKGEA